MAGVLLFPIDHVTGLNLTSALHANVFEPGLYELHT